KMGFKKRFDLICFFGTIEHFIGRIVRCSKKVMLARGQNKEGKDQRQMPPIKGFIFHGYWDTSCKLNKQNPFIHL
ncbi:MAG: hypothetical protein ACOVOL_03160, partial [Bacteroidia bacterium]